jgi:hypothetical protein
MRKAELSADVAPAIAPVVEAPSVATIPTASRVLGLQRAIGNRRTTVLLRKRELQRQTLTLRSGHEVGVPSGAGTANLRSDAGEVLGRLLSVGAIDLQAFTAIKSSWAGYGPGDVIKDPDLIDLKAAIKANERPMLPATAAGALAVKLGGPVGTGEVNDARDVTAVQNRLIALGFLVASGASGTWDPATAQALTKFKTAFVAGTLGIDPLRSNEAVGGGADPFGAQTFRVHGNPITVTVPGQGGNAPTTVTTNKTFTVFIPTTAPDAQNKVHVFFTPLPDELKFVNEEGLRSEHEGTPWILIAVPALFEQLSPNWVTIETAEIQKCLAAVMRSTTIDALRLSAHSRGHRGLEHTLGLKGSPPTIDLKLVERVTVFDASYKDLGDVLRGHAKDLTQMQDPTDPSKLAGGTVNLYDVTVGNVSGFAGKRFNVSTIRALAYVRFVFEGLLLGKIDQADIAALPTSPKDVQGATNRLLKALPPRGGFSTRTPTPAGKTDLATWLAANKADLAIVDDKASGLSSLVVSANLDLGYNFDANPKDPNRSLTPHHWLAAELGHESLD